MLGLNISYYRKLKGLTQMQLAEAIDISRTHMSNIEAPNMPTSISLDTLLNIADTLDIPAASLLHFGSYSPFTLRTVTTALNRFTVFLILNHTVNSQGDYYH